MKTKLYLSLVLSTPVVLAVPGPGRGLEVPPAPPAEFAEPEVAAPELGDPKPKGIGFLGVSAQELPFGMAEALKVEQGVLLTTVMANMPAGKAGLKVNDIITEVAGKEIGSMLELRDAIRAHKEGDRVAIKVVQDGKLVEKRVTLAAAPPDPPGLMQMQGGFFQGGMGLRILPGPAGGGMRLGFGADPGQFQMQDDEGAVEVKGRAGKREVTVRGLDDEILFEGPWVTPQDKAAAAPHIRKRIDRLAGVFGDDEPFQLLDMVVPEIGPNDLKIEPFVPDFEDDDDAALPFLIEPLQVRPVPPPGDEAPRNAPEE